jgi:hypothetical protein
MANVSGKRKATANVRDLSILIVVFVVFAVFAGIGLLMVRSVQSSLPSEGPLPAQGLWRTSMESIFISVAVVFFGGIMALIPAALVFSLYMGIPRQRVKGDLWADISRMDFEDYLLRSAELDVLLKPEEEGSTGELTVDSRTLAEIFSNRFDDFYRGWSYLFPILLYLILCFIGWMMVLFPNAISGGTPVTLSTPEGPFEYTGFAAMIQGGLIDYVKQLAEAGSLFTYAFLGAYFWSFQDLLRRFWGLDLKPGSFMNAIQRVVSGWILAVLFTVALPSDWVEPGASWWVPAFGFFLGIFTLPIVEMLWRRLRLGLNPFGREEELTNLRGLNIFHAERLLEEGIENIHSLTTVNLLNLLTRVRYSTDTILDWVDQALLHRHAGEFLPALNAMGILTASDLLDIWTERGDLSRVDFLKVLANALPKARDAQKLQEEVAEKRSVDEIRSVVQAYAEMPHVASEAPDLMELTFTGVVDSLTRDPNFRHVYAYWQVATQGEGSWTEK